MLALLAVVLAVDPAAETTAIDRPRSTVQLELTADHGVLLPGTAAVSSPGAPFQLAAEAGWRVWRPQLVDGGGRPVLRLAVRFAHSFYDSGDAVLGVTGLGAEIGRLTVLATVGFGLGFPPGSKPRPEVPLGVRFAVRVGPVSVGASYERLFQLGSFDRLAVSPAPNTAGCFSLLLSKTFDVTD